MNIDQPQVLALAFLQDDHPVVELRSRSTHVTFTIHAKLGIPKRNRVETQYFYVSFYDEHGYLFSQDYFSTKIPLDYKFSEMASTFELTLPSMRTEIVTIIFANTTLPPTTQHLATILDESAFFTTQIHIDRSDDHG